MDVAVSTKSLAHRLFRDLGDIRRDKRFARVVEALGRPAGRSFPDPAEYDAALRLIHSDNASLSAWRMNLRLAARDRLAATMPADRVVPPLWVLVLRRVMKASGLRPKKKMSVRDFWHGLARLSGYKSLTPEKTPPQAENQDTPRGGVRFHSPNALHPRSPGLAKLPGGLSDLFSP